MAPSRGTLGWLGIVRLGLVQTALGAIVVLATSTLNRVMVVEFALPATVPGFLVALHYAVQMVRPRFGHGSDVGGQRTRWILGGMLVLAIGGTAAAAATALMSVDRVAGIVAALLAYTLIGLGVGAAGTSLLVLLAKEVEPTRRAAAATILWIMMIAGFAVTSGIAGHYLDPFSTRRLVAVTATVAAVAFTLAAMSVWGIERGATTPAAGAGSPAFRAALAGVWAEPQTRRFTIFVFVSMLAYSAQELILEPFAGLVYRLTPGASAQLSGTMHGGAVLGMVLVAVAGSVLRIGALRTWVIGGCIASAAMLVALGAGAMVGPGWPLHASVFALGVANGAFAVAAIGAMMELAGAARDGREGVRMGLWGGAQAVAFAIGGIAGTGAVDVARHLFGSPAAAYAVVFGAEALMFLAAARIALAPSSAAAATDSFAPLAGRDAAAMSR